VDVGGVYGVGGARSVYLDMLFTFHLTSFFTIHFQFRFLQHKSFLDVCYLTRVSHFFPHVFYFISMRVNVGVQVSATVWVFCVCVCV